MDIRNVKKLIDLLDTSNVDQIEIHEGEESVRIRRHRPAAPAAPPTAALAIPTAAPAAPAATPAEPAAETAPSEGNDEAGSSPYDE